MNVSTALAAAMPAGRSSSTGRAPVTEFSAAMQKAGAQESAPDAASNPAASAETPGTESSITAATGHPIVNARFDSGQAQGAVAVVVTGQLGTADDEAQQGETQEGEPEQSEPVGAVGPALAHPAHATTSDDSAQAMASTAGSSAASATASTATAGAPADLTTAVDEGAAQPQNRSAHAVLHASHAAAAGTTAAGAPAEPTIPVAQSVAQPENSSASPRAQVRPAVTEGVSPIIGASHPSRSASSTTAATAAPSELATPAAREGTLPQTPSIRAGVQAATEGSTAPAESPASTTSTAPPASAAAQALTVRHDAVSATQQVQQQPTPASQQAAATLAPQLAKPLMNLASAAPGEHVLTITVTPENLGPVTVRAHVSTDDMRIELFAPTDQARDAVRNVIADLRRDLSGSGLSAQLDLSSRDQPTDERPGELVSQSNERDAPAPSPHNVPARLPADDPSTSVLDVTV